MLSACNNLQRQYKLPKGSEKNQYFAIFLDQLLPDGRQHRIIILQGLIRNFSKFPADFANLEFEIYMLRRLLKRRQKPMDELFHTNNQMPLHPPPQKINWHALTRLWTVSIPVCLIFTNISDLTRHNDSSNLWNSLQSFQRWYTLAMKCIFCVNIDHG